MFFPSVRNVGLIVLGFLVAANPVLSDKKGYDVSNPKEPLGPLKVGLDYGLATTWPSPQDRNINTVKRNWQYSSHIKFASRIGDAKEKNPPVSDGQLWKIARDAVDEMTRDRIQYGISDGAEPTAMGILAWGSEIILASSMKGAGSFSYDFSDGETPVGKSLEQCQISWKDTTKEHKNKGNCAEPLAAHLYYKRNEKALKDQKARVGTWVKQKGSWEKTDPCGTGREDFWGCNLFTKDQGLEVMDVNEPLLAYTLSSLAGGPILQEQIQLCGGPPRVYFGEDEDSP